MSVRKVSIFGMRWNIKCDCVGYIGYFICNEKLLEGLRI